MPETEMLLWIALEGDEVAGRTETELTTKRGWRFVRSRNGLVLDGNAWKPKYIWSRV
jgi:hypothetical protein